MADLDLQRKQSPESVPPVSVVPAPPRSEPKRHHDGARCNRVHVVMVPGFGGFDALGQLRYYPRTTDSAAAWREDPKHQREGGDPTRLVIHYFDNLPTAGVNTRAHRLLLYLLDRQRRNDFNDDDAIVLVGHSTGGLDIRRLLQLLLNIGSTAGAKTSSTLRRRLDDELAEQLRSKIKRVVFLSVPQRGTNIANWVRAVEPLPMLVVGAVREAVDWLDFRPIEPIETGFIRKLVQPVRACVGSKLGRWVPDLHSAILDVFAENAMRVSDDPVEAADGRESLAELSLFLNQTDGDFFAIDDLAAKDPTPPRRRGLVFRFVQFLGSRTRRIAHHDTTEVARASEEDRAAEIRAWAKHGIETLSFATFANPGVCEEHLHDEAQPRRWGALLGWIPWPFGKTDGTFRFVYRACQWGPFSAHGRPAPDSGAPDRAGEGRLFLGARDKEHYVRFRDGDPRRDFIRSWENDGIVNTASMLWPNGPDTLLVQGDHADIIGHFAPKELDGPQSGRKYEAYDIFGSDSGFDEDRFNAIWHRVFDFSLAALSEKEPAVAVA